MDELELERAYETLGLHRNAPKEEVEKKYDILLRRERARKQRSEESANAANEPDFEQVNRAYRLIIRYEHEMAVESINAEKYGKYKKYAGHAAKLDHFFSNYKWHVVGVIAAIAIVIYGINAYIDHREEQARLAALPPPDLEAMLIGQFYLKDGDNDTEQLEQAIVSQIPGWQRVEAELLPLNMSAGNQADIAMQQKVVVMLATERPDVYILDADSFPWIAANGVLLNLDDIVKKEPLAQLLPEGAAMKAPERTDSLSDEEEPADVPEHVYGINIGDSPLAESLPLAMKDMVIGIRADAKRPEKALQLIEEYLRAAQGSQ